MDIVDGFDIGEYRCQCKRLLFKGTFALGRIGIKCPRCHRVINIKGDMEGVEAKDGFTLLITKDGQIVDAAPVATAFLGFTHRELVEMKIWELDMDYSEDMFKTLCSAAKQGQTVHCHSHYHTKHKKPIALDIKAEFVEWNGKPYMFAALSPLVKE